METIVCIFAHPDDEAFGPGGTITLLAQQHDVYIICVTDGDAGDTSLQEECELGELRREELERSAKVLGVKNVIFLGYKDGTLSNSIYHELAEKIQHELDKFRPTTLLTYEPRGVSGHIDHVAVSMVTSYIFEKKDYIKKIMYFCLDEVQRKREDEYFIYFPPGYKNEEINETIDTSKVWDIKVKGMMEHKSQWHDAQGILERSEKLPKQEHFLIKKKIDTVYS